MPQTVVLSQEQATTFAAAIKDDIRAYIDSHREEYEAWLKSRNEQQRDEVGECK